MKEIILATIICCALLLTLTACEKTAETTKVTKQSSYESTSSAAELEKIYARHEDYVITFPNIEEYATYVRAAKNGDLIDEYAMGYLLEFNKLENYYLPTNKPENYKLYEVAAYWDAVEFKYLPREKAIAIEDIRLAEENGESFIFTFFTRSEYAEQKMNELTNNKDMVLYEDENCFAVGEETVQTIMWREQDGTAMSICLPLNYEIENIQEYCKAVRYSFEEICAIEDVEESFATVEEFEDYVKAVKNGEIGEDIAELAELEGYYRPCKVPEGYALNRIIASPYDIYFEYLPVECMAEGYELTPQEYDTRCFGFSTTRKLTLDGLRDKFFEEGAQYSAGMVRDEYLIRYKADGLSYDIFREQDGVILYLRFPICLEAESHENYYQGEYVTFE